MHHQIKVHLTFPPGPDRDATRAYMSRCPFALASTAVGELNLTLHFCVTDEKLGWAKALANNPRYVGATQGRYEIVANEPDRSGELRLTPADNPPCGSSCQKCQSYLRNCGGCPVTPFYRSGYRFE
ncbi:MAG: hypothetical protein ACM3XN_04985 [Chloroflexota bacterium]